MTVGHYDDLEEVRALRREVKDLRMRADAPVLTVQEAAAYVGRGSTASFYRWARIYGVRPCSRGRYARLALDQGQRREARS